MNGESAAAGVDCDVLVVGGGINGTGIARDLAGRGWRVVLAERGDLAGQTSSASTKLLHGGLRYLEHYEFRLVRKALREREVLLDSAPHLSWPLRFVLPHDPGVRPAWLVRLGLLLYDVLAGNSRLPGTEVLDLRQHPAGAALRSDWRRAFAYSDGWVDDARLVVANALDAAARGARVLTRTACVSAERTAGAWIATLRRDGGEEVVRARVLVNATGPGAERFLARVTRGQGGTTLPTRHLRLVKGSHIVVPRCFEHDAAYLFQNPDRRIVFAIPYEEAFTLVGTTDVEVAADATEAQADPAEIAYLCEQVNRYFRRAISTRDVVWSFSGIRPLIDDRSGSASEITRDYVLDADATAAPLLSVWGGKLTTYRLLAEEAVGEVGRMLGDARTPWTAREVLPGGDLGAWAGQAPGARASFADFQVAVSQRYPWLPPLLAQGYARRYGTRMARFLDGARGVADLGPELAPGVFGAELDYLRREEWAVEPEDALWRRTKHGLHVDAAGRARVAAWFDGRG